jgi:transportin-3
VIEDYFRLASDAVRYYPKEHITSSLAVPIFSAALSALTLQQVDPLIATLHYYRDVLSFGFDTPSVSDFTGPDGQPYTNPPEVRAAVKQLLSSQGQPLVQRVLTGMMFSFPGDCFPDASGVIMTLFELMPQEAAAWVQSTIQMLPAGTMKPGEGERLMSNIIEKVQSGELRKIRVLLQGTPGSGHHPTFPVLTLLPDFTNSYRRRNVAPRDGLGRLEATRFRFSG